MSADRLFLWVRSKALFYRLTLFTRIMLATGFIPTGMVKLLGQRFTTMPPTTPIGAFFEAMYQTGLFWRFIGAVQVVAGVLLLVPRVAHLGALMFLPVIVSNRGDHGGAGLRSHQGGHGVDARCGPVPLPMGL